MHGSASESAFLFDGRHHAATTPFQLLALQCWGYSWHRCPMCFGRRMQRRLQAGAACEDLRFHTPHFYRVGAALSNMQVDKRVGSIVHTT
jgi:hypothetical protein